MGELPAGWEWKRLGDIGQYINGKAFKPSDWTTSGKPIVRIQNLTSEESNYNFFQGECEERYLIKNGDILISWSASLGVFVWNGGDAVLNQHIFKAIPNEKIIDRKFLVYIVGSILEGMKKYSHGSTMKHIVKGDFDNSKIPLPPLPIQRQIVAVLEQAEAVKRQRQEADALTGVLLQSIFFEMFGNPATNERGWPLHKMKNVCKKITDGTHDTPEPTTSGVPFIMGKHIRDRIIDFPNSLFVSKNVHDEIYRRCNPQQGDVILVHIGANLGNAVCINVPFEFSMKNIALLKPNPSLINGKYLESYLIFTKQNTKKTVSRGGAQQFMSIKEMELIPCLLPPIALQQQFARIVQDVERIRDQQVASSRQIEGLCEGLMQRAFAGELAV